MDVKKNLAEARVSSLIETAKLRGGILQTSETIRGQPKQLKMAKQRKKIS